MRILLLVLLLAVASDAILRVPVTRRWGPGQLEKHMKILRDARAARESGDNFVLRSEDYSTSKSVNASANVYLTNSLPQGSASYYGTVGIGTPVQNFDLDFDTGSSNTWVANPECKNCPKGIATYNHALSSTYVANGEKMVIQYGEGSVSGYLSEDTVTIAGISVPSVTFGEVTSEAVQPIGAPTSGLFGLAYQSIAVDGVTPTLEVMFQQGLIESNSFGLYLTVSQTGSRQGLLTLGGVDDYLFTPPLYYTAVTDQQWYVIKIGQIAVGSSVIESSGGAIVDSGTSCLAGPQKSVNLILEKITIGSKCEGFDDAPDITIVVAGQTWTMTPADYTLQTGGECQVCIQGFDSGESWGWILGDSFLHGLYVHFDIANNRLGFADAI